FTLEIHRAGPLAHYAPLAVDIRNLELDELETQKIRDRVASLLGEENRLGRGLGRLIDEQGRAYQDWKRGLRERVRIVIHPGWEPRLLEIAREVAADDPCIFYLLGDPEVPEHRARMAEIMSLPGVALDRHESLAGYSLDRLRWRP
ncbi:MAG: hypothetical protein KDB53_11415, partial [Planctomycetes bacterium]|nr:hypothetical protein [Planctomycetota bacterium]